MMIQKQTNCIQSNYLLRQKQFSRVISIFSLNWFDLLVILFKLGKLWRSRSGREKKSTGTFLQAVSWLWRVIWARMTSVTWLKVASHAPSKGTKYLFCGRSESSTYTISWGRESKKRVFVLPMFLHGRQPKLILFNWPIFKKKKTQKYSNRNVSSKYRVYTFLSS